MAEMQTDVDAPSLESRNQNVQTLREGSESQGQIVGASMTEAEARTCKDCGHDITRHGKEGCDVELGDSWVEGLYGGALMAQGVCSCKAWQEQTEAAA